MADTYLNKVLLIGRLGAKPELRYTPGGKAVCDLSVATSRSWKTETGERKERTDWHKIVVWGKRAEACARFLVKGQRVLIEGRLEKESYEKDGETRYATKVVAVDVGFLDKPGGKSGESSSFPPASGDDDDLPF